MFLRVNAWERSGVPIARTGGLTVYVLESQKNLFDWFTVDHYQDLTGGRFLITAPTGVEKSTCGTGFKFINTDS